MLESGYAAQEENMDMGFSLIYLLTRSEYFLGGRAKRWMKLWPVINQQQVIVVKNITGLK